MAAENVKKAKTKKSTAEALTTEKAQDKKTAKVSATKTKKKAAAKKQQTTTATAKKSASKPPGAKPAAAKKKIEADTTKVSTAKRKPEDAVRTITPLAAATNAADAATLAAASRNDCPTESATDREEQIRELAYLNWEAAGRPPGDGAEFWQAAEREIDARR